MEVGPTFYGWLAQFGPQASWTAPAAVRTEFAAHCRAILELGTSEVRTPLSAPNTAQRWSFKPVTADVTGVGNRPPAPAGARPLLCEGGVMVKGHDGGRRRFARTHLCSLP